MTSAANIPPLVLSIQDAKKNVLAIHDEIVITLDSKPHIDRFTQLFLHTYQHGQLFICDLCPYLDNPSLVVIISLSKKMSKANEIWKCCCERNFPDHLSLYNKQKKLENAPTNYHSLFKSCFSNFDVMSRIPPTIEVVRKVANYAPTVHKHLIAYAVMAEPNSRIEITRATDRGTTYPLDYDNPIRILKMIPYPIKPIKNVYLLYDQDGTIYIVHMDHVSGFMPQPHPSKFIEHLLLGKIPTHIVGMSISSKQMQVWSVSDNGVVCLWNLLDRKMLGHGKIDCGQPLCMARGKVSAGLPTTIAVALSTNEIWLGSFVHVKEAAPLELRHLLNLQGHPQPVTAMHFYNNRLYSGDRAGNLFIWSMGDSGEIPVLSHKVSVFPTAFSVINHGPDQLLVSSNEGEGSIFKLQVGGSVKKLKDLKLGGRDCALFYSENSYIASSIEGVRRMRFIEKHRRPLNDHRDQLLTKRFCRILGCALVTFIIGIGVIWASYGKKN